MILLFHQTQYSKLEMGMKVFSLPCLDLIVGSVGHKLKDTLLHQNPLISSTWEQRAFLQTLILAQTSSTTICRSLYTNLQDQSQNIIQHFQLPSMKHI